MAQTTNFIGAQVGPLLDAKNSLTIPATGSTTLLEVPTLGLKNIGVEFTVGVNSLDGFAVLVKFHKDGDFRALTSAITSTPAGLILAASGTLATQAVGTGWFIMDVRGVYAVRITASGSTDDTTTVAIRASGSR